METENASALPDIDPAGLDRLARALHADGPVIELAPLTGGLAAETTAFSVGGRQLVLKRFPAESGHKARVEFENLSIVASMTIETPEPILLDTDGGHLGTPTLVMSRISGRPACHAQNIERSTRGAAHALAAIHALSPERARTVVTPRWQRWRPPVEQLGADTSRAQEALDRLYASAVEAPKVFSHDDYNPGNVLLDDDHLSGVVDWGEITLEPREAAVALYRHMLAIHPGGESPDRFLTHYETASGTSLPHIPLWDVLYGLRWLGPLMHWVRAFDGHGLQITEQQIRAKSLAWIERSLAIPRPPRPSGLARPRACW